MGCAMTETPKLPNTQTIQQKLKAVSDLFAFAMKIKKHQLRQKFPNMSEQEITLKAAELIEAGTR